MIRITHGRIDVASVVDSVRRDDAGAVVLFLGSVRADPGVAALSYEAYAAMAEKVFADLAVRAREKFHVLELSIVHRIGRVPVGGDSVAVACSAAHRREAFDACAWAMDEVKRIVPIWKTEPAGRAYRASRARTRSRRSATNRGRAACPDRVPRRGSRFSRGGETSRVGRPAPIRPHPGRRGRDVRRARRGGGRDRRRGRGRHGRGTRPRPRHPHRGGPSGGMRRLPTRSRRGRLRRSGSATGSAAAGRRGRAARFSHARARDSSGRSDPGVGSRARCSRSVPPWGEARTPRGPRRSRWPGPALRVFVRFPCPSPHVVSPDPGAVRGRLRRPGHAAGAR